MRATFDPTTATVVVRTPAAASTASTISTAKSAAAGTRQMDNSTTPSINTNPKSSSSWVARLVANNNNNHHHHLHRAPGTRRPTPSAPSSSPSPVAAAVAAAAAAASSPPPTTTLAPQSSAAADTTSPDHQNKTNKHNNNSAHRRGPLHALNAAGPRPSSNHHDNEQQRSAKAPIPRPLLQLGANNTKSNTTASFRPNCSPRGRKATASTSTTPGPNSRPRPSARPSPKPAESRVCQVQKTPRRPTTTAATRSSNSANGDSRDRNIAKPSTTAASSSPSFPSPARFATTITTTSRRPTSAITAASNNPAPAPARSRPAASQSTAARPPLAPRNQNARLVAGRANPSSMSKNVRVTMPYDRSSNTNGRPQVPARSVTAQRGINKANKAPLTPKVAAVVATTAAAAARPTQGPTLAPSATARTSLPKRPQRINTANSLASAPRSSPQPPDDDRPHLSNVTPRSGTRQSRVDSANSTPSGTPNPDRHDAWSRDGRPSPDPARRPTNVAFSPIPTESPRPPRSDPSDDFESKFFHASDAPRDPKFFHANDVSKPSQQPLPPKTPGLARAPGVPKSPTFFYANETANKSTASSLHAHKPSLGSAATKFVYANGVPEARPSPPPTHSRPSSVVSSGSRAASSRLGAVSDVNGPSGAQRPPASPIKLVQQAQFAQPRTANIPHVAASRPPVTSSPQLGTPVALRRTSTGTSRSSHSRGGSLVLGEADLRSAHISSGQCSPLASPFQAPLSLASIIQAAEEFGEDADSVVSHASRDSRSELHSPTRSTHSADPINELIAGARRERKVQDLQITNASLEAINRTLERQMRKQSAELRRYKRLSRTGTLSAMTSTIKPPEALAIPNQISENLDLSDAEDGESGPRLDNVRDDDEDEDEDEDEEDEEDSFSDTDSTGESLSPSVIAERDAKHKKRDEKRLQLDLTKHQQLLVDSQKLNQSIMRCLDWTELLIKDAKKALEYNVRVSDIDMPSRPRVLRPPVDEDDEPTQMSVDFDPDTTYEDSSLLEDETVKPERVMPLEPKLAGWKPNPAR